MAKKRKWILDDQWETHEHESLRKAILDARGIDDRFKAKRWKTKKGKNVYGDLTTGIWIQEKE